MDSVFLQIGVVTILAAALGIVARVLHQPILLAYIAAGVVLGGGGLHLIDKPEMTRDIATIGIIFLLFLVGLELDVSKIRRVGRVVLITGLIQLVATIGLVYVVVIGLHYDSLTALYLGLAAAFSSTAVVLKRLSDRRELSSLYARVTVGILLLQDVLAILALMVISGIGSGEPNPLLFVGFIAKGLALFIGTWLVTKYMLGRLFYFIAKSTELLFLTSIAWAFLFALIADSLGFSKEIGAFLAGLSLATLPYNFEIIGRVKPLKDFFLVIFFVVLGLEISWPALGRHWPVVVATALIVVFVKSFVAAVAMVRAGYPKRPAYLTGAALGQMSEFSLLILLIGSSYGHVGHDIVAIVAALLAITIVLNTYWNGLNRFIYPILSKPLRWFGGPIKSKELTFRPGKLNRHTLLFGANRMGAQMLKTLEGLREEVLVVDHNPVIIRRLLRRGVQSVYGDIDDLELLHEMGLDQAKMVISTVPNTAANLYLIEQTRHQNPSAVIIVSCEQIDDALSLYGAGADYVILPHLLGGERAATLLQEIGDHELNPKHLKAQRGLHIAYLKRHRPEIIG